MTPGPRSRLAFMKKGSTGAGISYTKGAAWFPSTSGTGWVMTKSHKPSTQGGHSQGRGSAPRGGSLRWTYIYLRVALHGGMNSQEHGKILMITDRKMSVTWAIHLLCASGPQSVRIQYEPIRVRIYELGSVVKVAFGMSRRPIPKFVVRIR